MTEQELISKIQSLKQIKPRNEWVVLAKTNMFNSGAIAQSPSKANYASYIKNIFVMPMARRLAYSFAVSLVVVVGGIAFIGHIANNGTAPVAKNSPAALAIKSSVEDFKAKSVNLSKVAKTDPKDVSAAVKQVAQAAQQLTDKIQHNPQLAKEVALDVNNSKTYLDITGNSELKETSDNLYKTIVEQMIKDLEHSSLAQSQADSLRLIEDSYAHGNYTNALEDILLLNSAISQGN